MKFKQKLEKTKQMLLGVWRFLVLKPLAFITNLIVPSQESTKSETTGQKLTDLPPNPMGDNLRKPERYKFENGEWWYYYPKDGTSIETGKHIKERASTLRRKLDKTKAKRLKRVA